MMLEKQKWILWIRVFAFRYPKTSFIGLMMLFVCFGGLTFFLSLPNIGVMKDHYPVIEFKDDDAKSLLVQWKKEKPARWVGFQSISSYAKNAVRVSEDWEFYHHHGIDFTQVRKVIDEKMDGEGDLRGASTITQQLARNLFLHQRRSWMRKLQEFFLALRMERAFGKDKIFEYYLNVVEWGPGVFGIRMASYYYFDQHPNSLGPKEGAFLAMLLPSPIRYGVSFREKELTPYAQKTVNQILDKMVMDGVLPRELAKEEKQRSLSFEYDPWRDYVEWDF
ncbi:MAG: biosynthetic peptidoglycan transglycosylase [Bdellovibrionota bacterium]